MAKNEVVEQNENTEVAVKENTQLSAQKNNNKVTDYSLGIFGTSDNFIMAMQMAKALSSSTLVPREYQGNESNCLIAIDMSQRFGASPFEVMRNLDIIQGRPCWKASALIGMINASSRYDMELQFEEKNDSKGKPFSCRCWTTKHGRRVDGPVIDMDMAIAEKWVDKNGSKWKTMPQVMLRYRAASFFSRMNCPEISMGLYTSDEIIDGDFKEYPLENMQAQVQREIESNANQVDFSEVVEPQNAEQDLPEFMSAEWSDYMRLISQNGTVDVPYDIGSLAIGIGRHQGVEFAEIYYYDNSTQTGRKLAEYNSKAKAQKAMEMLRTAYTGKFVTNADISDDFNEQLKELMKGGFGTVIVKDTNDSRVEFDNLNGYFQFPQDEDVEV